MGDDLLRRDLDRARARVDDPHAVDAERQQQVEPRRRQLLAGAPEAEHHRALVLLQHPHPGEQQRHPASHGRANQDRQHVGSLPPSRACGGRPRAVSGWQNRRARGRAARRSRQTRAAHQPTPDRRRERSAASPCDCATSASECARASCAALPRARRSSGPVAAHASRAPSDHERQHGQAVRHAEHAPSAARARRPLRSRDSTAAAAYSVAQRRSTIEHHRVEPQRRRWRATMASSIGRALRTTSSWPAVPRRRRAASTARAPSDRGRSAAPRPASGRRTATSPREHDQPDRAVRRWLGCALGQLPTPSRIVTNGPAWPKVVAVMQSFMDLFHRIYDVQGIVRVGGLALIARHRLRGDRDCSSASSCPATRCWSRPGIYCTSANPSQAPLLNIVWLNVIVMRRGDRRRHRRLLDRRQGRAEDLHAGEIAVLLEEAPAADAGVLRTPRRQDDHHRPLHADLPHLRARSSPASARWSYRRFLRFNVFGGIGWVLSMTLLGFTLGKVYPPITKQIDKVIIVIIAVSLMPMVDQLPRSTARRRRRRAERRRRDDGQARRRRRTARAPEGASKGRAAKRPRRSRFPKKAPAADPRRVRGPPARARRQALRGAAHAT